MATIERTEEHVVHEIFVLKYDRVELEERAANPLLMVREIESALRGKSERKAGKVLAVRMTKASKKPSKKGREAKMKAGRKAPAVAEAGEGQFQCKQCPRTFSSDGRLQQHERSAHDDVEIGSYKIERGEAD